MRRRRPRASRLYLVAATAMAAMAAVLVHGYLGSARAAAPSIGPQVAVVVAAQPIQRGTVLAAPQLAVARLPQQFAPPGSIGTVQAAAGRVALADLAPHEVVTETRLARVRAGPVASLIPRGLRAFAVPTSLPPGAVVSGDRVDVVATYASGQAHSEVVVEGIEIMFVLGPGGSDQHGGQEGGLGLDAAAAGAEEATTLILLVSPDQEERLAFARAFASLEVAIEPAG
jgi:Flp pilus assembly protein CpaB